MTEENIICYMKVKFVIPFHIKAEFFKKNGINLHKLYGVWMSNIHDLHSFIHFSLNIESSHHESLFK